MDWLVNFIDWFNHQLGRIKTVSIIVLVVLFSIAAINNGCQKQQAFELVERVTGLNIQNDILKKQNRELDNTLDSLQSAYTDLETKYAKTDSIRKAYSNIISGLRYERDTLKDYIRKTPTSELYAWLDQIRYPYQGDKKYKFNQPQVNDIYFVTKDYDIVKEENQTLSSDIEQCNYQLVLKDSLLNNKVESMFLYQTLSENKSEIIQNMEEKQALTEDQIKKYKRKLFWWKVGTGTAIVAGILIAI
jgi:hypothetical protein